MSTTQAYEVNSKQSNGLNLPYALVPEPTSQELKKYGAHNTSSPSLHNTSSASNTLAMLRTKATVHNVTLAVGVWTAVMAALSIFSRGANSSPVGNLFFMGVINLVSYGLIRWSMKGGYFSTLASVLVSWVFYAFVGLNLDTLGLLVMQMFLAFFALQKTRGRVERGVDFTGAWKDLRSAKSLDGVASIEASLVPVWGAAGTHIANKKEFNEAGIKGAEGEKILGNHLNNFAKKHPHVRVFHGLCFTPGKPGADVDHVVVINNVVMMVDAKFWSFADYSWKNNGVINAVLKNGEYFKGSEVNMDAATQKWIRYIGNDGMVACRITAVKTEAKNRNSKFTYTMDNTNHPEGVELRSVTQLLDELENIVKLEGAPFVNRVLVEKVRKQLQE